MKQEKFQHGLMWPLVVFSHPSAVHSSVVSICSSHDSLEKVTHLMTCERYLLNINQCLFIQGDEFIFSFCRSYAFSPTPLICGILDQPLHCTQPPVARCSISLYFCSELWCSPRCSPASALCSQISLRLISPPAVKMTHNLAPHTPHRYLCLLVYVHSCMEGRWLPKLRIWKSKSLGCTLFSVCCFVFHVLCALGLVIGWSRKEINN